MPERYTSLVALTARSAVDDVGAVVAAARDGGVVDRHSPVGDPREAQEVHWGGRMQSAVVRRLDDADGTPLLRTEAYIGADGATQGLQRQAALLRSFADVLGPEVTAVRDLSAAAEHDLAWLRRVADGQVRHDDVINIHHEGRGTHWVHSHGAARLDVPDLELYGLRSDQVDDATAAIRHVHQRLLRVGLRADLALPDGTPVFLVPVRRAWQRTPLDWPGVGRAGQPRQGHEGPRATLSVLGKRRFGRHRIDLDGVRERLGS
jgi:hypothetical protein